MAAKSYGQHCALAKSLDMVGDRWTLLVVRELLDGPRRYVDLLHALAPIATDMLAARLRELEKNGLVSRRTLPPPAAAKVYELTDAGRALEDVINAFERWGRGLLETRNPEDLVRPQWLARAVRAYARDERPGVDLVLQLVTPEGSTTLHIDEHAVVDAAPAEPDVTLVGSAETLAAAMNPARFPELVATGALTVNGRRAAVRQLAKVFGYSGLPSTLR